MVGWLVGDDSGVIFHGSDFPFSLKQTFVLGFLTMGFLTMGFLIMFAPTFALIFAPLIVLALP